MDVQTFLDLLEDVQPFRKHQWTANCPFCHHLAKSGRLTVTESWNKRPSMTCHNRCDVNSILRVMNLTRQDLFIKVREKEEAQ
ncbi:MAG: hypothetical protein ACREPQ_19175 [Rhodanobacter sp.]